MSYDKQNRMFALKESDEVFCARMKKGIDDVHNGRITPLDEIYAKLSEVISELKNGAPVADAEEFIKGLMKSSNVFVMSFARKDIDELAVDTIN